MLPPGLTNNPPSSSYISQLDSAVPSVTAPSPTDDLSVAELLRPFSGLTPQTKHMLNIVCDAVGGVRWGGRDEREEKRRVGAYGELTR